MAKIVKLIISLFVSFHIMIMVMSSLPDRSIVSRNISKSLGWYQSVFGLGQSWKMFAPNPSAVNSYVDALITFNDGSTEKWTFPRSSQMDAWERFSSGERFRKYQQANLTAHGHPEVWRDLALFLEREVNKLERSGRGRIFEEVQFYRNFNVIPSPEKELREHGQFASDYKSVPVFHYQSGEKIRHEAQNDH